MRRNAERFPDDFVFQTSPAEFASLKSQFATSSWGGARKLPLAFTEHGAIMAAMVLNSPRATEVSVYVVRAFVQLRDTLLTHKEPNEFPLCPSRVVHHPGIGCFMLTCHG